MVNLLLSFLVVLPALSVALTSVKDVKPEDLKYLGCYDDAGSWNRAFRRVYFSARSQIDWSRWRDLSYIVRICAKKLLESGGRNNAVFSVQDWGECRTDFDPHHYKSFSHSSNCHSHVGGPYANAVYKIEFHNSCSVTDPKYANGRAYYIPHGPTKCEACTCEKGRTNCNTLICDYSFTCQKFAPVQENTCCSKCVCHHLGKDKKNGEEWDDRRNPGVCFQCRCINGGPICRKTSCSENCPNPEYIPGRCCPRCRPKAPTTSPWEIIPLSTTRAAPTFPPFLAGGFGKRSLRKKRSRKAKVLKKMFKCY